MSKRTFAYQANKWLTLRIALAHAAKGDTERLSRYFLNGGRIIEQRDLAALGEVLMKNKLRKGRQPDTSEAAEAADTVLLREKRWRNAHPGKRLQRGFRASQIERLAQAAWVEDGEIVFPRKQSAARLGVTGSPKHIVEAPKVQYWVS